MEEDYELPEFYISTDNKRVRAPTYEALMPLQLIMTSAETGQTGPTRVEAGEHFTSESTPCHQWAPLNKAAAEKYHAWIASLPASGQGLSMEELSEAALAMRPREGEKEIPHEQWWPAVLKYASAMKDKKNSTHMALPRPGVSLSRNASLPVMPFMANGPVIPAELGRAPVSQIVPNPTPVANAATRRGPGRPPKAMPGTVTSDSPASATG